MGSIHDLEITGDTTVGDLLAYLSEEEAGCIREAIGPQLYDLIGGLPLAAAAAGNAPLPLGCLGPDNRIGLSLAFMAPRAGGLSSDSRACIREVAEENPLAIGIEDPGPEVDASEILRGAMQVNLCLTDEEAAALSGADDSVLPPPSDARCLVDALGGLDTLLDLYTGQQLEPEDLVALLEAAATCDTKIK